MKPTRSQITNTRTEISSRHDVQTRDWTWTQHGHCKRKAQNDFKVIRAPLSVGKFSNGYACDCVPREWRRGGGKEYRWISDHKGSKCHENSKPMDSKFLRNPSTMRVSNGGKNYTQHPSISNCLRQRKRVLKEGRGESYLVQGNTDKDSNRFLISGDARERAVD